MCLIVIFLVSKIRFNYLSYIINNHSDRINIDKKFIKSMLKWAKDQVFIALVKVIIAIKSNKFVQKLLIIWLQHINYN
jgi:hypothetical protein